MKPVFKDFAIIALIAFVLTLLFWQRNTRIDLQKAQDSLVELVSDKNDLAKVIDDRGREISSMKAIVLSKNNEIEKNLNEISELKSLDTKVIIKTKTRFDTMTIALHDTTIIYQRDTLLGKSFNHRDQWLSMGGSIISDSLQFDSLEVRNQYSLEIGEARVGLFKKETKAFLTNQNPYSSTTDMSTFVLKPQKKWYERSGWKLGVGALAGFFIARKL
jgi:predicted RNA-binding protein YlqC (UPF0109 family)